MHAGNNYATAERHISREEADLIEAGGSFNLGKVSVSQTVPVSKLLKIPMLKEVATIYFFVNILRFAVYMWLPIYLHTVVGYGKVNSTQRRCPCTSHPRCR